MIALMQIYYVYGYIERRNLGCFFYLATFLIHACLSQYEFLFPVY